MAVVRVGGRYRFGTSWRRSGPSWGGTRQYGTARQCHAGRIAPGRTQFTNYCQGRALAGRADHQEAGGVGGRRVGAGRVRHPSNLPEGYHTTPRAQAWHDR